MTLLNLADWAPLLVLFGPLATFGGAYVLLTYQRAQRLSDRLGAQLTDACKAGLRMIADTDARLLAIDPTKAEAALQMLLQFQQIASSVSSNPALWDHALAHHDHQLLVNAIESASLLIQLVRRTNWSFDTKAWNGSRRRAFGSLLKACRISLPLNR